MTAAVTGATLGEPFVVLGLRELFGAVSAETFAFAGRATLGSSTGPRPIASAVDVPRRPSASTGSGACAARRCGHLAYPRITPAMIVLVRRGDEALLARGARFPLPFHSTLAGFVEVGESLEETVSREVAKVAIEVKGALFREPALALPSSLMIGFMAESGRREGRHRQQGDPRGRLVPAGRAAADPAEDQHRAATDRRMGRGRPRPEALRLPASMLSRGLLACVPLSPARPPVTAGVRRDPARRTGDRLHRGRQPVHRPRGPDAGPDAHGPCANRTDSLEVARKSPSTVSAAVLVACTGSAPPAVITCAPSTPSTDAGLSTYCCTTGILLGSSIRPFMSSSDVRRCRSPRPTLHS